MATKAATALSKPSADTTEAVTKWLGPITPAVLATQVTKRFSNVAAAFTSTLTSVADFGTDDAVYFFCIGESNPEFDELCDEGTEAVTENKLTGSDENSIALCPRFFAGITLAADTAAYQTAVKAGGPMTVNFPHPRSNGVTLVHEAQHSLPIQQSTNIADDLADIEGADTPAGASNLSPDQKQKNAENWDIIAFIAEVAPARLGQ